MPKTQHLLVLSDRPEILNRVYDSPVASPCTLTLASQVPAFTDLAQRFSFHGYVLDTPLAKDRTWGLFQELKRRTPAAFFCFLFDQSTEKGLQSLIEGPGGWFSLHPPFPLDLIPSVLMKNQGRPAILFESPEASADGAYAGLRPLLKPLSATSAPSLAEAAEAAAKKPGALLILHAPRLDTPLAAFVRETLEKRPDARVLVVCDQPLPEAARAAARNNGWVALPRPLDIGFFLDQMQPTAAGAPEGAPAPTERILVVDDEPNLLDFLVDILSEQGYAVEGCPSGSTALAAMKKTEFHLALVDFQLGDTTGLALARELRQIDPDINIILMTAHASLDMAVKAIQADVYDYLIKPVDTHHLKRSMSKALEKRRLALEIKALVADLQKANHQLNRLNDLKSRFLSIVTHDLRTPLTSIRGYAQVLNMQKNLPEPQKEHFLKIIEKETDHLGSLISDLMDFVSIEAGKLRVEKLPSSVAELLDNVQNRMASLAEKRNIVFRVDIAAQDVPKINMDPRRIEQVLTNLIGNAFKHTPEGGQVTLTARVKDGAVLIEVQDTGEGIPPEDLPRIFEQFYQVEAHASKREGIGLGLSIAKEIVQAHGGQIGVHSDGAGKGSRFWLTLPLPAP